MPYDIKIPFEIQTFDVHGYDLTAVQGRLDHAAGQYCNPQSGDRRIDQGAGTHGFPGGGDMNSCLGSDTVKDISGSASFFTEQEALLLEFLTGYGLSLLPALVCGAQNGKLILHVCFRNDPGIARNAFDQGKIQGICQDFMLQGIRLFHNNPHVYSGADLRVGLYISGHELRTDGDTGADAQNAL